MRPYEVYKLYCKLESVVATAREIGMSPSWTRVLINRGRIYMENEHRIPALNQEDVTK